MILQKDQKIDFEKDEYHENNNYLTFDFTLTIISEL